MFIGEFLFNIIPTMYDPYKYINLAITRLSHSLSQSYIVVLEQHVPV